MCRETASFEINSKEANYGISGFEEQRPIKFNVRLEVTMATPCDEKDDFRTPCQYFRMTQPPGESSDEGEVRTIFELF